MSHSEHLDFDPRQELLSTMSSFNHQAPSYFHDQDPSYILMDTKAPVDWQASNMQSHHPPSSPPAQVSNNPYATQPPSQTSQASQLGRTVLRSPFSGNVFWQSMGDSFATSSNTTSSQFGSAYVPIHHQYPSSSSIYQPSSAYGSMVPSTSLSSTFSHSAPSPGMPRMLAGHHAPETVTPNALQGSTPIHYPHTRPVQIPTPQPYSIFSHRASEPSHSTSNASPDRTTMMMLSAASSSEDVAMSGLPSYDSEFLSSPSPVTDDELLADTADILRARQLLRAPRSSDAEAKDAFLLQAKRLGLSYREIKQRGNFKEAESTLRGRYRTITKAKQERVRKPVWRAEDLTARSESAMEKGLYVYS
ncbi:hypothetical protein UA08_07761 [Talaromyces atroroseus]|uniref:Uncharacterized protein n=1 Tax=Talaromyces atroroseus TaxID=1441469 RepID=A0A225ATT0_TALAT|nr:hypothetical protein UA08_07761 [Talaromyces atroroseus]OKL56877.1 hypothetical protein UA08_07761 [Talaromyces atroroseus]